MEKTVKPDRIAPDRKELLEFGETADRLRQPRSGELLLAVIPEPKK